MRELISTRVSEHTLSIALLMMRIVFGGVMAIFHGWHKLSKFKVIQAEWNESVIGLSPVLELSLVIFAEFFCTVFLVLGLFTRLATIPLIITMGVVFFKINSANFSDGQLPLLFLTGFAVLLFTGAGKFSLDRAIFKSQANNL
jgi:putative oxidoreductase